MGAGAVLIVVLAAAAAKPAPAPDVAPPPPPPPAAAAPAPAPSAPFSKPIWVSAGPGPAVFFQGGQPALLTSVRGAIELPVNDRISLQGLVPFSVLYAAVSVLGLRATVWGLSVVPAARFYARVHERIRVMFHLGLGLAHYRSSVEQTFVGYVTTTSWVAELSVVVGVEFKLTDSVALFAEPAAIHTGFSSSAAGTWWSGLLGLVVKLPVGGGS